MKRLIIPFSVEFLFQERMLCVVVVYCMDWELTSVVVVVGDEAWFCDVGLRG